MALMTPEVNGARQELPCLESPEINGARQEVAAVEKYVDSAWQEIWSAMKWMQELENTLKVAGTGYGGSSAHDYEVWYVGGTDENDGGYVTYYLEGDFTDPTLSFEYDGYYNYMTDTADRYVSAGSISRYLRTKSGTESYTEIISSVNTSDTGSQAYSSQINGEYDRVGIKLDFSSWSGGNNAEYLDYFIEFWNLRIDGKECLPSEECVINR